MYELYSERHRKEPTLDIYEYENFSETFRNQFFYILSDVFDKHGNELWKKTYDFYVSEKGLKTLCGTELDERQNIENYVATTENENLLDFIDFSFSKLDKYFRKYPPNDDNALTMYIDLAIIELNHCFKRNNLGYEFIQNQIIRIDNKLMHNDVVKPALKLLYENEFEGANQEFLKAFEYRKENDNKNAILEALKSFESTMKTICERMNYEYNKDKDTASDLINILYRNRFFPPYLKFHLDNLCKTLKSGLPTLRNKESGHGQGETVENVSDEFVEYAINLAATNIVLLVKLYYKKHIV